jgi:hypothetical protein
MAPPPLSGAAVTVCGTPTVYVPTPPLEPAPTAVTTVPGSTPGPTTGEPTPSGGPPATDVTVSVVPEMEPENAVPEALAVEKGGTFCTTPTVYAPAPPPLLPPPTTPVTTVPGTMPEPVTGMPTASAPRVTLNT